jgi:putative membrane protein
MPAFTPYCGSPPVPGSLHWNSDFLLIGVVFAIAALAIAGPGRALAMRHKLLIAAGALVLLAGFVSPLCNLSVALFSARVAQHMLFTLLATPLIAAGLAPLVAGSPGRLAPACCAFMATLWFWHSPAPYDATLQDNAIYWTMHATTIAAALWLWIEVFANDALASFAAVTFTGLQMCALGAVLTLSTRALFIVHATTTAPWGLARIDDQRLGGLLMWVPGGLLFTVYSLVAFWLYLQASSARRPIWE